MTITRSWRSLLKVILFCISTNLNYLIKLTVLKPNTKVNLATRLESIILVSKCHDEDSIESKDPNEAHGTRLEFQKMSNRQASVHRRRVSMVSMRLIFLRWPHLFIHILAGCVGIPSPAYSAPFLHCITTLDGTIVYFHNTLHTAYFWITSQS